MKKYYRLFIKVGEKFAYVENLDLSEKDRCKLLVGEKIDELSLETEVKRVSGPFPDLMGSSYSQPLVSDKLKEILLQFIPNTQIQFLPVKVHKKTYWLLNVLNNLSCFDWDRSVYTTYSSGVLRKVKKGVLKSELLDGIDIFRVEEKPIDIFISEKLKTALEENNITGISIVENDNWDQTWDD
ncbi:MAG: hypothetical protein FGM14_15405 [Flavobacteriales bacterium]|nr:hypothetical protein [Flavobacteriales bacterium]